MRSQPLQVTGDSGGGTPLLSSSHLKGPWQARAWTSLPAGEVGAQVWRRPARVDLCGEGARCPRAVAGAERGSCPEPG